MAPNQSSQEQSTSSTSLPQPQTQPTINSFFSRAGESVRSTARNSVANVMQLNRHVFSSSDEEDETEMDMSENRKRAHGQLSGDDEQSNSMITNTSLLPNEQTNPTRRHRLSTELATHPEATSTPSRIDQEMMNIRNNTDVPEIITLENDDHHPIPTDHSTISNENRIDIAMTGIREIASGTIPPPASDNNQGMTWDNSGMDLPDMRQTLEVRSPLPVPNITEEEDDEEIAIDRLLDLPTPVAADPLLPLHQNEPRCPTIGNLQDIVKTQLDNAFQNIHEQLIGAIERNTANTVANTGNILTISVQVKDIEEREVVNIGISNALESRLTILESLETNNTALIHQQDEQIGNLESILQSQEGHIDRLETALTNIRNPAVYQSLLNRITTLEQAQNNQAPQNNMTEEETDRIRKDWQRKDDDYFMTTLKFKGFTPVQGEFNPRYKARDLLKLIDAEDIMSAVSIAAFAPSNDAFRLTFRTKDDLHHAVAQLSTVMATIKRNGHRAGLAFTHLTPPRFNEARQRLHIKGMELKRNEQISRFKYIIKNGKLAIKVSKAQCRDWVIEDENIPASIPMDTNVAPGHRCPICLSSFSEDRPLSMQECGHIMHTNCIKSSLSQGIQCPVCRSHPIINGTELNCMYCKNIMEDGDMEGKVILTRKCNHLHLDICQRGHLDSLPATYDYTIVAMEALIESNNPGCRECITNPHNREINQESRILHPVAYSQGMSDYADTTHLRDTTSPPSDSPPDIPGPSAEAPPPSPSLGARRRTTDRRPAAPHPSPPRNHQRRDTPRIDRRQQPHREQGYSERRSSDRQGNRERRNSERRIPEERRRHEGNHDSRNRQDIQDQNQRNRQRSRS